MRLTLFTAAALVATTLAAVVKNPSAVGPLSPEKDPRTSLEESIRRMRLSIDRELVYLARMEEMKRSMNTDGMVARQVYPADDETESTFHGFTDKVNDGTDLFRPIRPGVNVPSARQFDDEPEPSDAPVDPPAMTDAPVDPPVMTDAPFEGGNGDDGEDGEDGPMESEAPVIPGRPGRPNRPNRPNRPGRPNRPREVPVATPDVVETEEPGITLPPPTGVVPVVPTDEPSPIDGGVTPSDEPSPIDGGVTPITPSDEPFPIDGGETPVPTEDTATILPTPDEGTDPDTSIPIPGFTGQETSPEPSLDSSPAPSPEGEDDDDVCFPAHATVQLENGSTKKMSEVQLGDRVLVASGEFSEVFMFTHKMSSVRHSFVELTTASGHNLALTKGHYLYVNDRLATASTVRKGDTLVLGKNVATTVEDVKSIMSTGLFNPQTVHGDIVVNGVRASTYTLSVEPKMAHALLAPLRAVYDHIGFSLSAFDMGADYLASLVPSGSLVN